MKIRLILFLIILATLTITQAINPYHVLELQQGATEDQIRAQYKTLIKKSAKDGKIKQQLYEDAYQQIMIDSTLDMTLSNQEKRPKRSSRRNNRKKRRGLPRLSDMFRTDYFAPKSSQKSVHQKAFQAQDKKNYAEQIQNEYDYQLPPQYDDPSYYQNQQKAEQIIKDENIAFNKKAAGYVLFFFGILVKLSPCICVLLICRFVKKSYRQENQEVNPFTKAMNGWSGKNRRQPMKKTK